MTKQLPVGQGLLMMEASLSHSDMPYSIGCPSMSDQPYAKTLHLRSHNTHKRDTHVSGRIRTRYRSKREATWPRLRPRGLWELSL